MVGSTFWYFYGFHLYPSCVLVTLVQFYRSDTTRDDKRGTLTNSQSSLLELAAIVFCRVSNLILIEA